MKRTLTILTILVLVSGIFLTTIRYVKNNNVITGQAVTETKSNDNDFEETTKQEIQKKSMKVTSTTYTIETKIPRFSPIELEIKKGDSVVWINNDDVVHWIYSGYVVSDPFTGIDSGRLKPGEKYSVTFNQEGIYTYRCKMFPYMRGKIIVK